MNNMTQLEFGLLLRKKRKEAGVTNIQMREHLSSNVITRLERGEGTLQSLILYLNVIGVSLIELNDAHKDIKTKEAV